MMDIDAPSPVDRAAAEIGALCDRVEALSGAIAGATGQPHAQLEAQQQQRLIDEVTGIFVRLRLLHRRLSEGKAAQAAAVDVLRRDADALALALENRQSEAAYIRREIAATQTQQTIYQHIELASEAEFFAQAPPELTRAADSPHALMLARLRFEIAQRDRLAAARDAARARRDELRAAKRRRIEWLERVDGRLQAYIKSARLLGLVLSAGAAPGAAGADADAAKPAARDGDEQPEPQPPRPSRAASSRTGTPRRET
ncbi:hypothetical protein H4S02_012658 [Coemansia sp. RSA 2611]|nr:hypothetical protein LPJ70_000904 [Coemansia sp. RSA 2708]KAJ2356875.1 hypothetical protein H4S02_012658 [Coemansia sp. RSA 2611]